MVKFIYGENYLLLKEELDKEIEDHKKVDSSLLNFAKFEDKLDLSLFSSAVNTTPFLSDQKLIIIKNILDDNAKELNKILALLEKTPSFSKVIWLEAGSELEKKAAVKKILNSKFIEAKSISPAQGIYLKKKVEEKIAQFDLNLSPQAWSKLLLLAGADYSKMINAIEKICLYVKANNRKIIELGDVDLLVEGNSNESIFKLLDYIAAKNKKAACTALEKLFSAGENELYILTMLIYQYRNLYLIKELSEQKFSESEIAKEIKVHPFVVKKTKALVNKYSLADLRTIFFRLQQHDSDIKKGKVDPRFAIELLILSLV